MPCSCGLPSQSSCQEMFDAILVREFSDFRYGRVHRLTVDTYSLQHPSPYLISAKSFAAHLTGMGCIVEYGNDRNLLRLLQQWLDGKKQLDKPELLKHVGDLTIAHIIDAKDAEEHIRLVQEWAADVWHAYTVYHDLAKEWIEQAKREFTSKKN